MSLAVVVTGATGFTGRRVVRALAARGHRVTAFVRASSDRATLPAEVDVAVGDLGRPETLEAALRGRDALVNVASLGFGHAPGIVAAARAAGIGRSVFVGTTAVRTTLPTPSKAVRLEAEHVVLEGGIGATLIRPTMIYGAPGDRNLERLLRFVRRFPVVPVPGGGGGLQQPVHVDDVAGAIAAVAPRGDLACRRFDVAGPAPMTFRELLRTVAAVLGRRRLFVPVPAFLARIVASREQIARLAEDKSCDVREAAGAFGYAPRAFEVGIRAEASELGLVRGEVA